MSFFSLFLMRILLTLNRIITLQIAVILFISDVFCIHRILYLQLKTQFSDHCLCSSQRSCSRQYSAEDIYVSRWLSRPASMTDSRYADGLKYSFKADNSTPVRCASRAPSATENVCLPSIISIYVFHRTDDLAISIGLVRMAG